MQGKLVPQDPEDEPASALYKKIQVARGRPIEEMPVDPKEGPFKVPETWQWVRLRQIGRIVGGGTPRTDYADYFADYGIPWLTPADLAGLRGKFIGRGRRDISELGLKRSSARLLPKGTVLFSSRAPIGYVAIAANDLATNQGFKSCIPYIKEMNEFIYYFLKFAAEEINRNAPGTTFKEVSGKIVKQILMPLPPLAEQRRIVTQLDRLMNLLDRLETLVKLLRARREELGDSLLNHVRVG